MTCVRNPRAIFFFFFHYENASGCLSRNPYPLKLNWKNSILHDRRHYVHALCERLWNISFFFFLSLHLLPFSLFDRKGLWEILWFWGEPRGASVRFLNNGGERESFMINGFMLFVYVCIKSSCEIFWLLK